MITKRIEIPLGTQISYKKDEKGGNVDGVLRFSLYKYLIVKMTIVLALILRLILMFSNIL